MMSKDPLKEPRAVRSRRTPSYGNPRLCAQCVCIRLFGEGDSFIARLELLSGRCEVVYTPGLISKTFGGTHGRGLE